MKDEQKIPLRRPNPFEAAVQVIAILKDAGHEALLAGGCVRDMLLNREPNDFDIATSATPDEVEGLFENCKAVGKAFGVVIVNIDKAEGQGRWDIEVATFRVDGEYIDGRRPDSVTFATAKEDAERRDFTINGLFADLDVFSDDGKMTLIDYVDGANDLQEGVIKAIGDPNKRFEEDYLRTLRAVRFAARYGFSIEEHTANAIRFNAENLSKISRERIGNELRKMISSEGACLAMDLIHNLGLDGPILGEECRTSKCFIDKSLPAKANFATRMATWLVDRYGLATPLLHETMKQWSEALCLTRDEYKEIAQRVEHCKALYRWDDMTVSGKKRFINGSINWYQNVIFFMAVDGTGNRLMGETRELMEDGVGLEPDPFLNGNDVIDAGIIPGPNVKVMLDQAYDMQLEGDLKNRDEAMDWLTKSVETISQVV